MGFNFVPASPDNAAIGEIRDLLKESKKQSRYMLWLTIAVVIMAVIQTVTLVLQVM
jgi:hypothetical protein